MDNIERFSNVPILPIQFAGQHILFVQIIKNIILSTSYITRRFSADNNDHAFYFLL